MEPGPFYWEAIKKTLFLTLLCVIFSCGTKQAAQVGSAIETIKVEVPDNLVKNYHELFDEYRLIPLETTEASIIGNIDRIVLHKNQIFILDSRNNSVFVFDDRGKFLWKIKGEGGGPGEYEALKDFTIDDKKGELILLAHRPYKAYYYDLEGNFIRSEDTGTFYNNVVYQDGQLILVNEREEEEFSIFLKNTTSKDMQGYLPVTEVPKITNNAQISFGSAFPYAVKSQSTYVFFPFLSTIYQVQDGEVFPRYKIDFGDHKLPENYFKNLMTPEKAIAEAIKNGYGFFIAHFRESKDYITFSYGSGEIVVYSKNTKKSWVFHAAHNEDEVFFFQRYFGHDGDSENKLFGIIDAFQFRKQMDRYKSNPETWDRLSKDFKAIDPDISNESNPILLEVMLKKNAGMITEEL